jgi:hypothetical protein
MKDLKELLGAKKKIDPIEKDAKLSAIKNMRKMAGDMMADDMQNMKKVTVAAPDEASLKKGLEKAKEVVGEMPEMESSDEEMAESPQEEYDEVVEACETPEDIDKLIAKLNEKKLELAKG